MEAAQQRARAITAATPGAVYPAAMTHASVPGDERPRLGIGDGMVRLSVGIEDATNLEADLQRALAACSLERE